MKRVLSVIFLIFFIITSFSLEIDKIKQIANKLEKNGVKNIKIIYVWGDGSKSVIPVEKFTGVEKHFYKKDGEYKVKLGIYYEYKGKKGFKALETKIIKIKRDKKLNFKAKIISKDEFLVGKTAEFTAKLSCDKCKKYKIKLKDIKFRWFFDYFEHQFDEGKTVKFVFNVPNGDKKNKYKVRLEVIGRYSFDGKIWYAFKATDIKYIKVINKSKIKLLSYDRYMFLNKNKTGFTAPFFVKLADININNDKKFYEKTNLFYKPILFCGKNVFYPELVDVLRHKYPPYNEIIYMFNIDKCVKNLTIKNGKKYLILNLKISDPNGIVNKRIIIKIR